MDRKSQTPKETHQLRWCRWFKLNSIKTTLMLPPLHCFGYCYQFRLNFVHTTHTSLYFSHRPFVVGCFDCLTAAHSPVTWFLLSFFGRLYKFNFCFLYTRTTCTHTTKLPIIIYLPKDHRYTYTHPGTHRHAHRVNAVRAMNRILKIFDWPPHHSPSVSTTPTHFNQFTWKYLFRTRNLCTHNFQNASRILFLHSLIFFGFWFQFKTD